MFQTLGTKGRTVTAAATAAATSSSSVAYDKAAVQRTPVSKHFSKQELKFKIEEDWLAIDGEEVWPVADISNAEIEDAVQLAMQLVPHNIEREELDIQLPPSNGSSSDHDSADDDVIVLKTPAMAMDSPERTMGAEIDNQMLKMVNACMRDANIQRAFIQNPEFLDLLLKLKQGPQTLPSAPLGPFEIDEAPIAEDLATHMRPPEGHTLKGGHLAHFAQRFPQADHQPNYDEGHGRLAADHEPNYDEGLQDAFMQFSDKLVDGVGSLIHKLADSCRKVWEQSSSLAKRLNHQPPAAQNNNSNRSNKSNYKSDPYDFDNCAKAGLARSRQNNYNYDDNDDTADEHIETDTRTNEAEVFLRGVISFAAVVFAIIVFKRMGMRMGHI